MADDDSPLSLWQKAGGQVDVDSSKGPAGSQEQIQHATGAPRAVESSQAPVGPPSGQSGIEILDRMDHAVKMQESGDQQLDASGKIKTSSTGNLGVSQLGVGTAKSLGVDPYDETQNREGGKRYLSELYSKYGNWNDALMAYNWGPGNVDHWIAGDRKGPVPSETLQYVPAVLGRLGMTTGADFVDARDKSPLELWNSQHGDTDFTSSDTSKDDDAMVASLIGENQGPTDMSPEGQDESVSMTIGMRNGLRDLIAGPVQTVLQGVAPETAKSMTDYINKMDEPFERQTSAHPYAYGAGNIIGTSIGILTLGRVGGALATALPMTRAATLAIRSLPSVLKAVGGGFLLGYTSFNKDPDSASRLAEGIIGSMFGLGGEYVAKAISAGARAIADKEAYNQFVQLVKKNYGEVEPSLSKIKDDVLSYYERTLALGRKKYTLRTRAGEPLGGYPSGYESGGVVPDSVAQLIEDAKSGKVGFDEKSGMVKTTANQMERDLGLDKQRQEYELFQKRLKDFDEEVKKWDEQMVGPLKMADMAPHMRQQMVDKGLVPPRPQPPEPFEAKPITPAQMEEARRTVAKGQRKGTVAARTQHGLLARQLDEQASKTAREAGYNGDYKSYERAQARADKFWKEKVTPVREMLKNRTPAEARRDMDPSHFFGEAINVLKGDNRHAQERFRDMLSPKGREEVRKAIFSDMLGKVSDLRGNLNPQAIADYIRTHRTGMETMLGRDEADRLVGLGKIAEGMTKEFKAKGFFKAVAHHGWMMTFTGMALFEGHFAHAFQMGAAVVGVETIRSGLTAMQHIPRVMALMSRAGRATPAQLEDIMRSVDSAMETAAVRAATVRTGSQVGARVLPQATGGEPVSTIDEGVGEGASMFYDIATQQ